MKGWTLDDIPWRDFDKELVSPDLVKMMKAACLVEHNGGTYERYLHNVFGDDPAFVALTSNWAKEEVRHGQALAAWLRLADPSFDFDAAFEAFTDGQGIPIESKTSIRGSRSGELVARCVVEAGTSSWYTALSEASDEPVLKEICRLIAADEFRHYKLFYDNLKRYLAQERVGFWQRLRIALGRLFESEDHELAYAYYCGNHPGERFDHRACSRAYARRAYGVYRFGHVKRGMGMLLKAAGLKPHGHIGSMLSRVAWWAMRHRRRRLDQAIA